jgi:hypothetical protein
LTNRIEKDRLQEEFTRHANSNWKRWGPYLADRQWGTVREDYSADGTPWEHFPHDQARYRAYRWGEDGLLGFCDRQCRLCFAPVLWNGRDSILKERLFGLSGPEGNHGEDVKESYFYLDATPTYSYAKALYKYPQAAFPYDDLVAENGRRSAKDPEYELVDTGVFAENCYFDICIEYAKNSPEDILVLISAHNCGPESAPLHLLPSLWLRNTWQGGSSHERDWSTPKLFMNGDDVCVEHASLGRFHLWAETNAGTAPTWLFTNNETRDFDATDPAYSKDAFHQYLVENLQDSVRPDGEGTKAAAHFKFEIAAGETRTVRLRLSRREERPDKPFSPAFDEIFSERRGEADAYYAGLIPANLDHDEKNIARQAYAGLLWSKQFYHYVVADWKEDERRPATSGQKRNLDWGHLFNRDLISMPDKWEYPWYAAWDSAFHMLPFSRLDPHFAKEQLLLFLRDWYMHPNGQIPAYEWEFGDVNPPVHAWACWRVYQVTGPPGKRDRAFLARAFHRLLLNFTWWVNRKDLNDDNLFSGGFLGLDNIGIFDRSKPLPTGGHLEQADGTAWMAYYCSSMLSIAMELAVDDPAYDGMASKFFEHYVAIAQAMNNIDGTGLWDEEDGFYYDHLHLDGRSIPMRIRSMVGIIPLFTVDVLYESVIDRLPDFRKRMQWFLDHKTRGDLPSFMTYMEQRKTGGGASNLRLLALPTQERLRRMLNYILDEEEFLSPYGVRSLSKIHANEPFTFQSGGKTHVVEYEAGESSSYMFGGNSNWRGPIWLPLNFLLIEALERYYQFYRDGLKVECPTGSGQWMNLREVAREIEQRLLKLFAVNGENGRPCHGGDSHFKDDPRWRDLLSFHEYFHAESGRGLGASHQTGWTALITLIMEDLAVERRN